MKERYLLNSDSTTITVRYLIKLQKWLPNEWTTDHK